MIKQQELRQLLSVALDQGLKGIRLYVKERLSSKFGGLWDQELHELLPEGMQKNFERTVSQVEEPKDAVEFSHVSVLFTRRRDLFKDEWGRNVYNVSAWLNEINDVRNKFAHSADVEEEDALRAVKNLILFFRHAEMPEWEQKVEEVHNDLQWKMLSDEFRKKIEAEQRKAKSSGKAAYQGPLRAWFRNTMPHLDIQRGHLDESVFAANLGDVARGEGREVYQNRDMFFEKTYFTKGLRTIAQRVIKGLNGEEDAENRVISLQTGFGGGKTHSLITLYHLAKAGKNLSTDNLNVSSLLEATGMPSFDSANVAVFTNATNDPAQGRTVDGIQLQTIWGELAYQLGGKPAYELIRKNDENLMAPAGIFRKVLEMTRPCLILIDELADYCVKASGRRVGSSTLSDQTISFVQELSEAIAQTPNCVLVATLPASESEVATSPQAAQILTSLSNRLSRVGKDTKPVEDEEIFEVIRYRLFEDLGDDKAIDAVVAAYMNEYQGLVMNQEIPSDAAKNSYRDLLRKSYPFHPELIDMFRKRWASNHDFQRTRGVLRLLASIVSDLWQRQSSLVGNNALIHTSDVHFENLDALSSQLKKLYGNGYDAVITADVAGSSSNAFKIDQDKKEYGQYDLSKGVAATMLLGTFGSAGGNKGLSVPELKLCTIRPDSFNHNSINGVLDEMENRAHYLYYSSTGAGAKRYWFHTKPNINILINQAKNESIQEEQIHQEIVDRLRQSTNRVSTFKVVVDPDKEIPEQRSPTLLVFHPKYQVNISQVNGKVRPLIERIATRKGDADRVFRNTMLFFLCSELGYSDLKNHIREYLACQKVRDEYRSQLEDEQKADLRRKVEESNQQSSRALVVAYSVVAKWSDRTIQHLQLKEFRSSLDVQISTNLMHLLEEEEWLLDKVGYRLLERNNLLPTAEKPIAVKTVYEAFLRYDSFPMITTSEAIKESLERYCFDEEIAIASGDGQHFTKYYLGERAPYFDVTAEEYYLVTPESVPKPVETPQGQPTGTNEGSSGQPSDVQEPAAPPLQEPGNESRVVPQITISGTVGLANYTQLFNSFINPLKNNNVTIDIKITAIHTPNAELTENSPQYKIAKESAKQLGLDFEEG